jgi:uncharacterized protein YbjT (DUF2867 family)
MADGLMGLYKLAEAESPVQTSGPADLELILARSVISIVNFADRYKIDPSSYIYRPPKAAPVFALVGASGSIGVSTLTALSSRVKTNTILAGVRDILHTKTHALSHLPHVELFQADMNHADSLKNIMVAADRVFIIAPGTMDRAELAINAINACKKAGTSFMVVLSVMTVERSGTIFGEQFKKVEAAAVASGVPHCIIRLPFFLDNVMGQLSLMMNTGKFYGPLSPNKKHNSVAVSDVGEAVAKIMLDPKPYIGRVLDLCGIPVSESEVAAAFAHSLGKKVEYVQVPFEATKSTMMGFGMPEGMVDGIIELYRMIEAEDGLMSSESGDLEAVLGRPPISIKEICSTVELSESSMADTPAEPPSDGGVDAEFRSGMQVLKKTHSETKFVSRFVWLDVADRKFHWSKHTDKKTSKSIRFSDIASVTGPEPHRHRTWLFGSVIEGSMIRLILKKGGSIDLKITAECPKKPDEWVSTLTAIID